MTKYETHLRRVISALKENDEDIIYLYRNVPPYIVFKVLLNGNFTNEELIFEFSEILKGYIEDNYKPNRITDTKLIVTQR